MQQKQKTSRRTLNKKKLSIDSTLRPVHDQSLPSVIRPAARTQSSPRNLPAHRVLKRKQGYYNLRSRFVLTDIFPKQTSPRLYTRLAPSKPRSTGIREKLRRSLKDDAPLLVGADTGSRVSLIPCSPGLPHKFSPVSPLTVVVISPRSQISNPFVSPISPSSAISVYTVNSKGNLTSRKRSELSVHTGVVPVVTVSAVAQESTRRPTPAVVATAPIELARPVVQHQSHTSNFAAAIAATAAAAMVIPIDTEEEWDYVYPIVVQVTRQEALEMKEEVYLQFRAFRWSTLHSVRKISLPMSPKCIVQAVSSST